MQDYLYSCLVTSHLLIFLFFIMPYERKTLGSISSVSPLIYLSDSPEMK